MGGGEKLLEIDERKMQVLSAVVDEYIKTGEPVGSKVVLQQLSMKVSSATVRNDMAALEQAGFLEQPHTSAGRVPTYLGYRFYIENLMAVTPLSNEEKKLIDEKLRNNDYTADSIVENAVNVLSELTELTVVSKNTLPQFSMITHVEIIPAGRRLYALLIITSGGTIKNKICRIEFDITNEQLDYFGEFISENLTGLNLEQLTPQMLENLATALGGYMMTLSPLLNALYSLSEEMTQVDIHLQGEQKLITSGANANEVVDFIAKKNELDLLLSSAFDGISVVFGKENDSFTITNSSMILSPYSLNNETLGSLGVIGPIRLDYSKVFSHIDYVTKVMTDLLDQVSQENQTNIMQLNNTHELIRKDEPNE